MAVIDSGPNIFVIMDEHEVSVQTLFNFAWCGPKLSGAYTVYIGDIPNHEIHFPMREEDDTIFLRESAVTVKRSAKLAIMKLPRSRKIIDIKRLLGIWPPHDHYTLEDLQIMSETSPRIIRIKADLESALSLNSERMIISAVKHKRPTCNQVLDIFAKAKELRSNLLMNLVRQLRPSE